MARKPIKKLIADSAAKVTSFFSERRSRSAHDAKRFTAAGLSVSLFFISVFIDLNTVHADSVTISADEITLYVGNLNSTTTLTAQVYPENVSDKEIEWESSNPEVAVVDDGIVTAVAEGEAIISAVSGDGEAEAECNVVVGKGVTAISFPQEEITLNADGAPIMLTPLITPSDATNKSLVWTSSDYDIVSVDSMGGITPHKAGTVIIGASSVEGKVTAACTVNVVEAEEETVDAEEIDISEQRALKTGVFTNYQPVSITLNQMLDLQCSYYNVTFTDTSAVASAADVAEYVNPQKHCSGDEKYQFLDLSVPNNLTAAHLDKFLKGKGTLSGMGQAFVDAAQSCGVSEAYLVAHACLETGNGSSQLARGVKHNGVTVYNMYGIGAYDGNALEGGAAYAYSQGWTTPEAAIKGGAAWIAKNYIYRSPVRQNTLYKMRWNPVSPGNHQYATDVGWAVKQSYTIAKIINGADCLQIFEIPAYKGTYKGYIPDIEPSSPPATLYEVLNAAAAASDEEADETDETDETEEAETDEAEPEDEATAEDNSADEENSSEDSTDDENDGKGDEKSASNETTSDTQPDAVALTQNFSPQEKTEGDKENKDSKGKEISDEPTTSYLALPPTETSDSGDDEGLPTE